ncbi:MAG: hypothetical protein HKO53_18760 [Gemmatimonadetes bacterium]|nr:hypothetical protein [Gemmatimonadota bacterium]
MAVVDRATRGAVEKAAGRLRFPQLFVVTAVVFVVDLFVPDALPFADEIFLALLTALLGSIRTRRQDPPEHDTGSDPPPGPGQPAAS